MHLLISTLIAVAILVALHLLRSAGRARIRGSAHSQELLMRHRAINKHHLRNGGVLVESLLCITAAYALAILMWAIAHGVMSITEPRW